MGRPRLSTSLFRSNKIINVINRFYETVSNAVNKLNIILEGSTKFILELFFIFKNNWHLVGTDCFNSAFHCGKITSLHINFHKVYMACELETFDGQTFNYFTSFSIGFYSVGPVTWKLF